jgi:hypothetical protein
MEYIEKIFLRELDLMKSRGFIVGLSNVSITDKTLNVLSSFYGVEENEIVVLFNKIFKNKVAK